MKYILMHKNTETAVLLFAKTHGAVEDITDIVSSEHMPPGTFDGKGADLKALNAWWHSRCIPASREGIGDILDKFGLNDSAELAEKCFGLSLSDHYWIRPDVSGITWDSINFFDNDFSDDMGDLLFGSDIRQDMDLFSPDNTSDGQLKKRWKIIGGKRVLFKAGSNPYQQEPFNEVIASRLAERLGISCVKYGIGWHDGFPYSKCDNFVTKNTELVSAYSIMSVKKRPAHHSEYTHFINCCEYLGIDNAVSFLDEMITFDNIILNEDRHFRNFGALRDPETLEYKGFAPLFDSGSSMYYNRNINRAGDFRSKPFKSSPAEQLTLVTSFDRFDISKTDGFSDEVLNILIPLIGEGFCDEQRVDFIARTVGDRLERMQRIKEQKVN